VSGTKKHKSVFGIDVFFIFGAENKCAGVLLPAPCIDTLFPDSLGVIFNLPGDV